MHFNSLQTWSVFISHDRKQYTGRLSVTQSHIFRQVDLQLIPRRGKRTWGQDMACCDISGSQWQSHIMLFSLDGSTASGFCTEWTRLLLTYAIFNEVSRSAHQPGEVHTAWMFYRATSSLWRIVLLKIGWHSKSSWRTCPSRSSQEESWNDAGQREATHSLRSIPNLWTWCQANYLSSACNPVV